MKFIENKEKYGLLYDLSKVAKEYKKLKIPIEYDFINFSNFENHKYLIDLSERSLGKTNCYLLLGMVFNKLYGTTISYIRERKDEIAPSKSDTLFEVILNYNDGKYIKTLTNEKYNSIYTRWGKSYYCRKNEKGEIEEKSETPFLVFLSCDKHLDYKGNFNIVNCDFIIYDEFIQPHYNFNASTNFFDLLSTIIRSRKSPFICMLANTLSVNNTWFEELCISKEVRYMKKGDEKSITTNQGTNIYVRILTQRNKKSREEKQIINKLFFGFDNPKLNAITGSNTWAMSEYQHIYSGMEYTKRGNPYFIRFAPYEFLRLQFANYKNRTILLVTRATKILEKDIVFTMSTIEEFNNCYFGFGTYKFEKTIYRLLEQNLVYYSTNEVGQDFSDYCYKVFNKRKMLM